MSALVHLDTMPPAAARHEGRDMHCGAGYGQPYTTNIADVTCVRCLEIAQADAEEMAALCIDRLAALREAARPPTPPGPPLPPIQIIADEACPPDRGYVIGSPLKVAPDGRIERGTSAMARVFQREAAAYAEHCAAEDEQMAAGLYRDGGGPMSGLGFKP